MDAVNLAVPMNTPANAAMNTGDNAALATDGEEPKTDFATLLAAGIDLQQQLLGTPKIDTDSTLDPSAGGDPAADPAGSAPGTDPNAALLAANAPQSVQPPVDAGKHTETLTDLVHQTAPRPPALPATQRGENAPQAAADTAKIAAFHAEEAKPIAPTMHQFELDLTEQTEAAELSSAQRTDAAEAAAQTLNLQAIEQRPAVQQPVAVREVGAPVGSTGFAEEVSRQVVWMVDKDAQIAELRINPPELGPVEVRLTVSGDHASAQFVSTHAEVREALETSIARLRESFAQAGIQLGEASVSAESFREQTAGQSDARLARGGYRDTPALGDVPAAATVAHPRAHRGLVDTFA